MNKNIEYILNMNLTAKEKLAELDKLYNNFNAEIREAKMKINDEYKYCPYCKEYYRKNAWETKIEKEARRVCTYWPLGDLDDPEYDIVNCNIKKEFCPKGHIEETNLDYRF